MPYVVAVDEEYGLAFSSDDDEAVAILATFDEALALAKKEAIDCPNQTVTIFEAKATVIARVGEPTIEDVQ